MNRQPFNMIEITIALGVVAVGIVAVVGAFPLAANKTRDAMAETYAAESATQVMAYLENSLRSNWSATLGALPTSKAAATYAGGTLQANTRGSIYDCGGGVYRIIRFVDKAPLNGEYDAGTDDILDFEAMMVIWVEQVKFDGSASLGYDIAVRLNAEISWPAQIPAAQRQKAFYTTELFRR